MARLNHVSHLVPLTTVVLLTRHENFPPTADLFTADAMYDSAVSFQRAVKVICKVLFVIFFASGLFVRSCAVLFDWVLGLNIEGISLIGKACAGQC